ncbi:5'-3' DNA helicase ZGRF1 isoform X2 [Petromyzon marinus]|uniref:5'-3' DNA helicase ZGRF1 isoform X2 n=1 Tax=Petromyzon marinus TaxID=7757 RepID=UPI003F70E267
MASQEFTVLYTHQKTKKAKAWQDGILRTHGNGGKAILFDDKGLRLDSVFLKGQKVTVGLELESDRFLITVEESTNPTNSLVSATPKPTNPEPPRRPCLPSFKRKHTTGSFRTPREVEVEVKAEESSPPALGSSLPGNGDSKASSLQQGHSAVCHPDYTEATESGPGNTVLPALWGSLPGRKSMTGKMPPRATLPSNEEYRGIPNNISGRRDGVIVRAVQPADLGGAEDGIGVLYEDRRDREADPDRKTSECIFVVDSNGRSTDAKRTKAQILALLMQGDGGGGAGAGQFNNSPSSQEKHAFWDQQFDQNGSKIGHTDRSSSQDKEQPILSNKQHCLGKLHCENQRQAYIENVQPHRGEEPSLIGQQPSQDKLWPYMGMDSCKQHSQAMPQPYQQQQHSDQYKHSDWSNAESSQGSVQLNPAAEPCLEKLNLYQDKQTYQNKVQPLKSKVQSHESLQPNPDTQSEYYELQSCLDDELHTIAQSSSERQPPFLDKIQPYTDMQPTVDKQLHCAELKLQNKQNPPEDQHPTSKIQPKIDTQPYQGKSQPNIDPQLQQDTLQPFPVSVALQNTLETHQQTQQEPTHLDPQSSQDSNLVHRTVPADVRVFRTEPTIQDSQPMVDFNVFSAWASELWAGDSQPGTFSEDASVQPAQPLPEQLHPAQLPATHSPVSVAGCVASDESSAAANGVGTHAVLPDSSGSLSMTVEPCNIEDEMRSAHYVPSKGHSVCGIGGSDGGEDDGIGSKGVDYACNVKASNSDSIIYEDCFIDSAPVSPVEVSQRRGKPIALLRATETYASQSQASVDTMDISLSLEEQDEQVEEATEVMHGACIQRERLPRWSSPNISEAEPRAVGHSGCVGQQAHSSQGSVTTRSGRESWLDADRSRQWEHGIESLGWGLGAQSSERHGAGKSGFGEEREDSQEGVLGETLAGFDSCLVECSRSGRCAPLERDALGWEIVERSPVSVSDIEDKFEGGEIERLRGNIHRASRGEGDINHSVFMGGSNHNETFRDICFPYPPVVKGRTARQPCLEEETIHESYNVQGGAHSESFVECGIVEKVLTAGSCYSLLQETYKEVSLSQSTAMERSICDQTFEEENVSSVIQHQTQAQCNASHASFKQGNFSCSTFVADSIPHSVFIEGGNLSQTNTRTGTQHLQYIQDSIPYRTVTTGSRQPWTFNAGSCQHPIIKGSNHHPDFGRYDRRKFVEGTSVHPLSTKGSGQYEVFTSHNAEDPACIDIKRAGGKGGGGREGEGRSGESGVEEGGGRVEGGGRGRGGGRAHEGSTVKQRQDRDCWEEAAQGGRISQPPSATNASVSCLQRFQQQHVVSSQDVFRDPEGLTPMHVLEPHQHFTHPECLSPKKKADPAQCFMAQRQQQDILASGSSDFEMSRCFEMSRDFGASTVLPTPCPPIATQSSHGPSYKPSSIQIRGSGLNSGSWESPETGAWQPAPHAIDRRLEGQEVVGGSGRRQHPGEGATTWRQRGQEEPAGRSGSSRWDKYHDSSLEHLIGAGDSLATGDGDDDDDDGGDGDELDFELEFNVSAEPTPGFNEYSAESGVLDWPSPSTLSLQQQCFPNDAVVLEERRSCTLIGPSPAERRALIGRRLGSSLARSRPSVVVCGSRPTGSGVLSRCLESSRQAVRLSELRFPSMESVLRQPTLKRKIIIPVSFSSPAAYKDTLSSAIIEHLNLILHDTASRLHRKKIGGLGSRGRHVSLYRNCRLFRRSVSEGFGGRTLVQRFRKKKFVTEEMNSGIKRKLFLLLNRKENHSSYSKDDLWVISTDAGFPPANVMVVCSVFYGPSASGELEVSPLREHTSSTWAQNATVHAIHVCNASWELSCLRNIRENVEVSTLPILPLMLSLEGSQERSVKSRRTGFRPPLVLAPPAHGSWVDPAQTWPRELAERTIAERGLNGEQGDVLRRVAHMIQAGAETAGVTIVQGVFGAGKSFMLSCIVMYLIGVLRRVKHEAGTKRTPLRVLISAATNVAVDRVLLGLLDLGFEEFVRVGSIKKIAKPILPFSLHAGSGNDSDQLRELQSLLKEELSPAERVFVKRSIETHKLGRNRNLLKEVSVVGATCASCPFPSMGGLCFPFVILDECSQITEPMSLLPIARFGCERLLLVGDPRQLPPTVQGSEPEHESGLEQTLFTRLKHMGHPLVQLRTQYRCHPHISLLAASLFYQGELRDGVGVAERPSAAPWLPTLAFLDVPGQEKMDTCGSYYNKAEVDAAVKLVDALVESRVEPEEIAVITLYRAQAARVHECLMSLSGSLAAVRVCTADAFQGGEVRVCVLSIVRSPRDSSSSFSSSSFVESEQRACVALTRARGNLVVLGCATSLGRGALWGRVLKHCQERGAVLSSREFSAQLDHIIAARGCGEPEGSRGSEQPQKKRRKQNPSKSPQASRKQPQPGDVDMLGSDWESGDEKLAPENDLNKSQGRPQRRRILDLGSESSDEE